MTEGGVPVDIARVEAQVPGACRNVIYGRPIIPVRGSVAMSCVLPMTSCWKYIAEFIQIRKFELKIIIKFLG